jgi:methionyl-tRNA formyltransferase
MNKHEKSPASSVRIVLFGSEGGFSRPLLQQLLNYELWVAGVVMIDSAPGSDQFPVRVRQPAISDGLAALASRHNVEVITTRKLDDPEFIHQLTEKQADILLVACFPGRIPRQIWQRMNIPCWNLHPSLLPKYRGPAPLYWQIKNNESSTGLTLHEVTGNFDTGAIVARKSLPLPTNHSKPSLDNWVAEHGVKLIGKTLDQYLLGCLKPTPQDESIASYYPSPQ